MVNKQTMDCLRTNINNYFNELSGNKAFSGAILTSIKGEKVINQAFGMANYELDVPNTPETKFRIGSVTKQFTAAAIMQLHEKGLLSLSDTLDKYIPDYPKGNMVTIHNLLTHTSGIFNYTNDKDFSDIIMRKKLTVDSLIEEFKNIPYDFEPGTRYSYSNSGYILLGYILEKITGNTYAQYINDNIFTKFSLNNSGYDDHIKIIKNRANGYSLEGEEKILSNCEFIDMSIPYAAGSLYSTVEDLYNWNNNLFEYKVVGEESVNQMISKHVDAGGGVFYGYGLLTAEIELEGKSRKKIWHGGGINGFLTSNSLFPDDDIQIIMITNVVSEYFGECVIKVESLIFQNLFSPDAES